MQGAPSANLKVEDARLGHSTWASEVGYRQWKTEIVFEVHLWSIPIDWSFDVVQGWDLAHRCLWRNGSLMGGF